MFFPLKDYLPHHRVPVVTLALIALNVLVYLMGFGQEQLRGAPATVPKSDVWVYEWGTIPCELFGNCENQPGQVRVSPDPRILPGLAGREEVARVQVPDRSPWLTIFASAFLHGGLLHLAANMLFLWVYGGNVEDSMSRPAFLGFYLSAAVVSALAQALINPTSQIPQIGASGAIAAVVGGYLMLYPRSRIFAIVVFPIFLTVPAWFVAAGWGLLQFLSTWQSVFVPGAADNGIAYMAHLAGFVFGLLVIKRIGETHAIYHQVYGGRPKDHAPPGW